MCALWYAWLCPTDYVTYGRFALLDDGSFRVWYTLMQPGEYEARALWLFAPLWANNTQRTLGIQQTACIALHRSLG